MRLGAVHDKRTTPSEVAAREAEGRSITDERREQLRAMGWQRTETA